MKTKILLVLLIISSLLGYLEWSGNNHLFLFQAELDIFSKISEKPSEVLHPFLLLPILSQLLLFGSCFFKKPNKIVVITGVLGIGLLLGFMFLIGCFMLNFKMIIAALPFLITAFYTLFHLKKIT